MYIDLIWSFFLIICSYLSGVQEKLAIKNGRQKDSCYGKIRLFAQNIHITLALIMNTFQRAYLCDSWKGLRANFFTINSYYNCCTLVDFETWNDNFHIQQQLYGWDISWADPLACSCMWGWKHLKPHTLISQWVG